MLLNTPDDLDKLQTEFYLQNPDLDDTKFTHDGAVYINSNTSSRYPNFKYTFTIDQGPISPKVFYLKFVENTASNPKQTFPVEVTYYRDRTPPILNGETIFGCLDNDNTEKYDLTQISLIKSFIDLPANERTIIFRLYRNQSDMNLNQNEIPESDWRNFILNSNGDHSVFLKMNFNDPSKKCFSESEIKLKLKDYSIQMEKTEYEFCGTPFTINGPNNQTNYQWYYNNNLKSSDKGVEIDALGEWTVYFDNDLGCRSSVKVNVIPEKNRSRIDKVTATSNSITIYPLPNSNIDSYSLDGINFKKDNTFYNQTADLVNIWYKTKLGCIFGPIPFDIANGFNFLSPNGDGINDTWNLRNKEFYKNAKIQIYDRYGKTVANGIVNDVLPWNGKLNNFALETDTYWFIIKDEKEILKSGYILLKNK